VLVRLDTIDRLENILTITAFLTQNFETNIEILECAFFNNRLLEKLLGENVRYSFLEDRDPILYRTRYLNRMISSAQTPYVAIWDTDVIVPVDQIIKAMELLRNGNADLVYPYEKQFLDTSPILRRLFIQEKEIDVLNRNAKKMKEMYSPNPVGGAFFANTKAYKEVGLENENFYGWGIEDGERYHRWGNLGYNIQRVPGPLFHLSHGRGINSIFHNADQQFYKLKELERVRRNKNRDYLTPNEKQSS